MSVLSDSIEQFIIEMMEQSREIAVQRNELAQHFACAPSQINYVLSTRFTLEKGYVIVSRRGGGGYILITRVDMDRDSLLHQMALSIGHQLGLREAYAMIERLHAEQIVDAQGTALMRAAVSGCALPTQSMQDIVRAGVMRGMVTALMQL